MTEDKWYGALCDPIPCCVLLYGHHRGRPQGPYNLRQLALLSDSGMWNITQVRIFNVDLVAFWANNLPGRWSDEPF